MPAVTVKLILALILCRAICRGLFGNARADVEASGGNTFNGKGGANASNTFSGTLTVTVDRVLVNGNLHVVGEKTDCH